MRSWQCRAILARCRSVQTDCLTALRAHGRLDLGRAVGIGGRGGAARLRALSAPSTRRTCKAGVGSVRTFDPARIFRAGRQQPIAARRVAAFAHPSGAPARANDRRACRGWKVISSHVRVSWSAIGEFRRARRDQ